MAAAKIKTAGKRRIRGDAISLRRALPLYFLMVPGLAYFVINNYMPLYGITIAFRKLDFRAGVFKSPFNGLDNFEFLFKSGNILPAIRNTVLYNAAFIVIGTVFAVAAAILFNEILSAIAKRVFQTAILLPHLMSMVVVSYLVFAFLSGDNGFISKSVIEPLTGGYIDFYQERKYWPFILLLVNQWKSVGFGMIVYYASILGISSEYYEAAKVDGASKTSQIFRITLPLLKPTIITMFILSVSRIFASDFGLFYQVTRNSGALYGVTQTIDVYVYNMLMTQNNISMSSAASVFQAVVGFMLVIFANLLIRKVNRENALF